MGINYNEAAAAYGFDPEVLKYVHKYENGGRTTFDYNNWDSNAKAGTPSAGPFQFIEPTFNAYAKSARAANPAAWQGVDMKWSNPKAQALAAAWAMANGKGSAWTTYKRAVKAAGGVKPNRLTTGLATAVSEMGGEDTGDTARDKRLAFIFKDSPWEAFLEKRDYATPTRPSASAGAPQQAAEGKGFFARRKGETGQQYLDRLLQRKFGLKHDAGTSQTTGGKHTTGSRHYAELATDYGNAKNNPATLQAAEDWVDQNRGQFVGGIAELLYGPDVPGHADHLHVATVRSSKGVKKR